MYGNTTKEEAFVTSLIRDYYRAQKGITTDRMAEREFGAGTFERKIAYRHLHFRNDEEFSRFLIDKAPAYVSYSVAYYRRPDARPMPNKGWIGAELVFDLDATDMHLKCQDVHGRSWICENCLSSVRSETVKLIEEFLIPDFGFLEKELEINFSGNRGYHVHVKKESLLQLSGSARKQISDYISGNGLNPEKLFPTMGKKGAKLIGPRPEDKGWGGKIARNLLASMEKGEETLESIGIDRATARNLYKKRALISMGIKNGNWDMVYIKNKAEFWKKILVSQAIAQSDRIDKNVTKDPTHLIRMPGTIHGETGLASKKISSLSELSEFDPMSEAIAFTSGELDIFPNKSIEFQMAGMTFSITESKKITLPVYAGVYLALKGLASIYIT